MNNFWVVCVVICLALSLGANLVLLWYISKSDTAYFKLVKVYLEQGKVIYALMSPSIERDNLKKVIDDFTKTVCKI